MSYSVEWMGGGVVPVYAVVLVLLIVPELAAIAVVVTTIAVVFALVALAAAALASPYLLMRRVGRRARPTPHDAPADRDRRLRVVDRAPVAVTRRIHSPAGMRDAA